MEDHISPMSYEMFIRRAHGCGREQKGASCDYFRNLQNTESGQLKLRGLGTADKQLAAVKGHLTKAVLAFLKPKKGESSLPTKRRNSKGCGYPLSAATVPPT